MKHENSGVHLLWIYEYIMYQSNTTNFNMLFLLFRVLNNKNFVVFWLIHYIFIYVLNTSGWQTLNKQLLWDYFKFKSHFFRLFPNWKSVYVLNSRYYFSLSECLEKTRELAKRALNFTVDEIYSLVNNFSPKSIFKSESSLNSNMVLTIWSLKSVQLIRNKPVHTSQKAQYLSIIRPKLSLTFSDVTADYLRPLRDHWLILTLRGKWPNLKRLNK